MCMLPTLLWLPAPAPHSQTLTDTHGETHRHSQRNTDTQRSTYKSMRCEIQQSNVSVLQREHRISNGEIADPLCGLF